MCASTARDCLDLASCGGPILSGIDVPEFLDMIRTFLTRVHPFPATLFEFLGTTGLRGLLEKVEVPTMPSALAGIRRGIRVLESPFFTQMSDFSLKMAEIHEFWGENS